MKLIFITHNLEKLSIAQVALQGLSVQIQASKINCPEIQADDNETIAKYSAKYASEVTKNNIIKTDAGLYIDALNGFPGPYSEYVERKLDAEDIINMMNNKHNRAARYKEVLAYCEYGQEPITFTTETNGSIAYKIDGAKGHNFDRIFVCNGDTQTMANFEEKERAKKYSHSNWINLYNYIRGA